MTLNIEYENFDWITYLSINTDIKDSGTNTKEAAWYHWVNYGEAEQRAVSLINNSRIHCARFGNLFFINLAAHFICLKNNLHFEYKYYEQFKKLGINLFVGENEYTENIKLTDDNFVKIIKGESVNKNIVFNNNMWCQTRKFCLMLEKYFNLPHIKSKIKNKNIFKYRYNKNNDLFIHVRLGDIENSLSSKYDYYDKILSNVKFDKGFIASDSIKSPTCQKLIKKYNLKVFDFDEITTIMFGSTCNNIILSGGTFSWLIGFLAFYSKKIFYPKNKINAWYGDIFIFPTWFGVKE
jgi:hypothetical protein